MASPSLTDWPVDGLVKVPLEKLIRPLDTASDTNIFNWLDTWSQCFKIITSSSMIWTIELHILLVARFSSLL